MSEDQAEYRLEKDEIVKSSKAYQPQSGVYFLIKNESIVYVGQSTNIPQRIKEHTKNKDFDKVFYVECKRERLLEIESFYIKKFLPPLNRTIRYAFIKPDTNYSFEDFVLKNELLNKIPLPTIRYWASQTGLNMESEVPVSERLKILDFYGWYVSSSRFTSFKNCLPQDVAKYMAYRNS